MKTPYAFFAAGFTIAFVAGLLLTNCDEGGSQAVRIARLENKVAFLIELRRNRRVSAEQCDSFSDPTMSCALTAELSCSCAFKPDEWDIENKEFNNAVAAKARELLAEQAAAEAAETEGDLSGTETEADDE